MRGLILLSAFVVAACGDDLPSESEILDYRLMAVVAEPPEVDPDGVVALTVGDFDPNGGTPTYRWSFCLLSFGSATNYACVDRRLQYALADTEGQVSIDLGPEGVNLRALYASFGPVPDAAGNLQTLEDGFPIYVRVEATSAAGKVETAYKRVFIREGDDLNTNPAPVGWLIDEAEPAPVKAGEKVEIKLDLGDAEREVDPDGNVESYLYQWLIVEGALDQGFGIPSNKVEYEAPEQPGTYPVFAVIRDRRGGTAFERLDVVVVP